MTIETYYSTSVLKAPAENGGFKFWQGEAVMLDGQPAHRTLYWRVNEAGSESRVVHSHPVVVTAKNVGRSNEVSAEEQAVFEITSKLAKKLDSGYTPADSNTANGALTNTQTGKILPMLAYAYPKRKHRVEFPMIAQPKLDGVRAMYRPGEGFWTRKGKPFDARIVGHLLWDYPLADVILDGELLLDWRTHSFQQTTSAVKKYDPELSPQLLYVVYDLFDPREPNMPAVARALLLRRLFEDNQVPSNVRLCPNVNVNDEDELYTYHAENCEKGYEGTMLRTFDGVYKPGGRGDDLLKVKDFLDDEFLIVDVVEGTGREAGAAVFVCTTKDWQQFNVRPMGEIETRKRWFAERDKILHRSLTVRYQKLSDGGVPIFPVGVTIRDYE